MASLVVHHRDGPQLLARVGVERHQLGVQPRDEHPPVCVGDAAAVQPTAHGGDDVFRQLGLVLPLHRAIPGAQREDVLRAGRGADIHRVADDDRRGFLGLETAERADPRHAQLAHVLGADLVEGAVAGVPIVRAVHAPVLARLRARRPCPERQSHGQDAARQRTPDVSHGRAASLVCRRPGPRCPAPL